MSPIGMSTYLHASPPSFFVFLARLVLEFQLIFLFQLEEPLFVSLTGSDQLRAIANVCHGFHEYFSRASHRQCVRLHDEMCPGLVQLNGLDIVLGVRNKNGVTFVLSRRAEPLSLCTLA